MPTVLPLCINRKDLDGAPNQFGSTCITLKAFGYIYQIFSKAYSFIHGHLFRIEQRINITVVLTKPIHQGIDNVVESIKCHGVRRITGACRLVITLKLSWIFLVRVFIVTWTQADMSNFRFFSPSFSTYPAM